jgi:CBS domain-containing protein
MTSGDFRHLPVVGDTGLVGIVGITDVCRALPNPAFGSRPPIVMREGPGPYPPSAQCQ